MKAGLGPQCFPWDADVVGFSFPAFVEVTRAEIIRTNRGASERLEFAFETRSPISTLPLDTALRQA